MWRRLVWYKFTETLKKPTAFVCRIQYNTIQYNTIQYNTIQYNKQPEDGHNRFLRKVAHFMMLHDVTLQNKVALSNLLAVQGMSQLLIT